MGQKVSPISFRIGTREDWQSKWFAKKDFAKFLIEDILLRKIISLKLKNCWVSKCEIERDKNLVKITIVTARPGMIIGRQGKALTDLKNLLSQKTKNEIKIDIKEVREPDLDASLVVLNIASQIEKRISFKRAMRQAIDRAQQAKAKGVKIQVKGRLGGVEIARCESLSWGSIPLETIKGQIDYGKADAKTFCGVIGVKVWINKR